jgi:alpha/beta superfamily hydrolase
MKYIYCHPLFDERKCAHRFSYQLSLAFEKKALELERFDYEGTGEADGQFSDVTMESLRYDLEKIANNDDSCLIGTRFGANVVYDHCCINTSKVKTAILIEPMINGRSYTEYLFRKQHLKDMMTGNTSGLLSGSGFCNLEGYKTSSKFLEQIKQVHLEEMTDQIKVDAVHVVQISASCKINTEFAMFADALQKSGIKTSVGVFNLPIFWERIPDSDYSILTKKIVEWCSE